MTLINVPVANRVLARVRRGYPDRTLQQVVALGRHGKGTGDAFLTAAIRDEIEAYGFTVPDPEGPDREDETQERS